jgi:hypothetical protein
MVLGGCDGCAASMSRGQLISMFSGESEMWSATFRGNSFISQTTHNRIVDGQNKQDRTSRCATLPCKQVTTYSILSEVCVRPNL